MEKQDKHRTEVGREGKEKSRETCITEEGKKMVIFIRNTKRIERVLSIIDMLNDKIKEGEGVDKGYSRKIYEKNDEIKDAYRYTWGS